jgi:hypothetical protein
VVGLPLVLGLFILADFIRGMAAREVPPAPAPVARAPINVPPPSAAGSPRVAAREKSVAVRVPAEEQASVLLKGESVGGQVLNDRGVPLSGARVFAASPATGYFVASSLTSKDGAFAFPDLHPTAKFLIACFPGTGVATAEIAPGDDPRRILLINHDATSRVSGVVSDVSGYPLGGATVLISSYDLALPGLEAKISFDDVGAGLPVSAADREGRSDAKVVQGSVPPSWGHAKTTSRPSGQFDLEKLGLGPGVTATALVQKPGYASMSCTLTPDGQLVLVRLRKLED